MIGALRRPPKRRLIRELRPGSRQSIEGDAIAIGEPLLAPFSGTECASMSVLHSYPYNVAVSGGGVRQKWTDEEFIFRFRFYVRDSSGIVRVQRCARSQLFAYKFSVKEVAEDTRVANLAAFRASPRAEDEEKVLVRLNASLRATTFTKARCHEVVIAQGSRVRVEGFVRTSGEAAPMGGAGGFRDAPSMLEFVSGEEKAMRITRIRGTR